MTLAPLVDPSIRGVQGKPRELDERCVVPECLSLAQERHHVWPRSLLAGQPQEWVSVQGQVIPNTCGLCHHHHLQVTGTRGHLAHIRWNAKQSLLEWWENAGQLLYEHEDRWVRVGPLRGQGLVTATPDAPTQRATCPSCGRPQRPERKPGPKRKVKTWTIAVPDDSEEGTEILDTYIEDLGVLMGFHDEGARLLRYHVLVPVLEWVGQNRGPFIRDWEESEE